MGAKQRLREYANDPDVSEATRRKARENLRKIEKAEDNLREQARQQERELRERFGR